VLFNSWIFVKFVMAIFFLYYLPGIRNSYQPLILLISSLYFYSVNDPRLVFLLLLSMGMNSIFSWQAVRCPSRGKQWLVMGITANLVLLAFFKYGQLLVKTLFPDHLALVRTMSGVPLPIGISFFTFEGISILVDCSRAPQLVRTKAWDHASKVSLLVAFFPHLVAGPILKAREFFPQIQPKRFREIDWDFCFSNLTVGYFLKMVVADNLKDQTFWMTYPYFLSLPGGFLATLLFGYSIQIFADFAGYSLIAIGLAGLFGYRLPSNFNYPYLSASFSEFWNRWHISLSTFLRDYLYIPLGGNRRGKWQTYRNLMLVMGLGGLWHGAAWSYAVWGLMHGLALAVERFLGGFLSVPNRGLWRWARVVFVFGYVTFAWLLFRLPEFSQVIAYLKCLKGIFQPNWKIFESLAVLSYCIPVILYHWAALYQPDWLKNQRHLIYGCLIFLLVTNSGPAADFIYFQF